MTPTADYLLGRTVVLGSARWNVYRVAGGYVWAIGPGQTVGRFDLNQLWARFEDGTATLE